jgi:hypothetical protein
MTVLQRSPHPPNTPFPHSPNSLSQFTLPTHLFFPSSYLLNFPSSLFTPGRRRQKSKRRRCVSMFQCLKFQSPGFRVHACSLFYQPNQFSANFCNDGNVCNVCNGCNDCRRCRRYRDARSCVSTNFSHRARFFLYPRAFR